MGFLTSLARAAPETTTKTAFPAGGSVSTATIPALGSSLSATGLLVSQATAMGVAAVAACVRRRASFVARCRPGLYEGGDRNKPVTDHPLARLFRKPNRQQTWYEFIEMTEASLLLRGNAYWVKIRDAYGIVDEMIPVNPDLVQVLEVPDGRLFYSVARQGLWLLSALQDMPISIPQEDVIHLRDLSFNLLLGANRLGLARDTVGLGQSQEQQAARWAGNGARPGGVIETDGKLTPEAATRLQTSWENFQKGVQNAGRTAVLESGMKWKPMQMTGTDMEFLASRQFQVREICRHFDTHPALVGEAQTDKATLTELNADYVRTVVMSDVARIEGKLERDPDFKLADDGLETLFDNRELLRGDPKAQADIARASRLGGIITGNEARAEIGYGRSSDPEADKLFVPTNLAPNGSALDGRAPGNGGRPPEGEDPAP